MTNEKSSFPGEQSFKNNLSRRIEWLSFPRMGVREKLQFLPFSTFKTGRGVWVAELVRLTHPTIVDFSSGQEPA